MAGFLSAAGQSVGNSNRVTGALCWTREEVQSYSVPVPDASRALERLLWTWLFPSYEFPCVCVVFAYDERVYVCLGLGLGICGSQRTTSGVILAISVVYCRTPLTSCHMCF